MFVEIEPKLATEGRHPKMKSWWDGKTFILRLTPEGEKQEMFFHGYSNAGLVTLDDDEGWGGTHPCLQSEELADELYRQAEALKGAEIYICPDLVERTYWWAYPCTMESFQKGCRENLGAEVPLTRVPSGEWVDRNGKIILIPMGLWELKHTKE